jgi:hypothetical protein
MQTKSPARRKLDAKIESQTTAQLLAHHAAIDAMPADEITTEHRLVSALMADVITARLGLDDAIDAAFEAADAREDYTVTYHEAILQAMVLTGRDA